MWGWGGFSQTPAAHFRKVAEGEGGEIAKEGGMQGS